MIKVGDKTVEHIGPLEKRDVQLLFTPSQYGMMQVPVLEVRTKL